MATKRMYTYILGAFLTAVGLNAGPVDVAPGRILVKSRDRRDGKDVDDACKPFSGRRLDGIPSLGVHVIEVPPQAWAQALNGLSRNPNFEFAEPDYLREPDATPNDPSYSSQWHLSKIQANIAWDSTTGSSSVIIAILDTGVDGTHPDLSSKLVPGWNFYDNNSNTSDVYGHGTAVAGTAAAASNNGVGVAGVAWGCKIMPIRISDVNGMAYDSTIATALNWAADHGARVANISFGAADSATVQTAAKYFQSKGGVVTVSSGNSSLFDSNPDNAYMLTVSATDSNDAIASFSNTGNNIDVAAPGVNIFTTCRGGGYGGWSGTSFSAPVVAGVAGLVFSANPALSGVDAYDIIRKNADDLGTGGFDTTYGYGRVNAYRAVAKALALAGVSTPPPTTSTTTPPPSGNEAVLSRSGGTLRNNYSGNVGFKFTAATNATITHLGRWVVSGSKGTHIVQLLDSTLTPIGSVAVNTSTATAGQFSYVPLISPVYILNGETYYLVSEETAGGDAWYNNDQVTIENIAIIANMRAAWGPGNLGGGKCYTPVSFQFTPGDSRQSAIISRSGGSIRNNYSGNVGFRFVAATNAIVTQVGRWINTGNWAMHKVQILDSSLAILGSVVIDASVNASGQFGYANLSSPISLHKGEAYFVFSTETAGGDSWYDCDQTVTENTALISQLQGAYGAGNVSSKRCYLPLDFRFTPTN